MPDVAPKLVLKCVVHFTEPTDAELRTLSSSFFSFLRENLAGGLFSYQSETVAASVELLRHVSLFTRVNCVAFYQYLYVRLYDTTRQVMFETMEKLVDQMVTENAKSRTAFESKIEVTIVLHSLARYAVSCPAPKWELVGRTLAGLNPTAVGPLLVGLLGKPEVSVKLLDLVEEALRVHREALDGMRELIPALNQFIDRHPRKVASLQQTLARYLELASKQPLIRMEEFGVNTLPAIPLQPFQPGWLFQPNDYESMAVSLVKECKVLRRTMGKGAVPGVTDLVRWTQEIARTKNALLRLNLDTRKDLLLAILKLVSELDQRRGENLRFDQGKVVSGEELGSELTNYLRGMARGNLESVVLETLLVIAEEGQAKVDGDAAGVRAELKRVFASLAKRLGDDWQHVDWEDIFRTTEGYLRKYGEHQLDFGVRTIDFMLRSLAKRNPKGFEENLAHFASPDFQAVCRRLISEKKVDKEDTRMEVEEGEERGMEVEK